MQHRTRMRIESDHCRHGADLARTLSDGAHDQLMAQVQTVKHSEGEHCGTLNLGVVSSVEETHQVYSTSKPSYAKWMPGGNFAESRACLMSCAMCVKNVRRGLIRSMYSSALSTQRCVGCSRKRRQSSTSASRPFNDSIVSSGMSLRSVR